VVARPIVEKRRPGDVAAGHPNQRQRNYSIHHKRRSDHGAGGTVID
jgi:hypothetical protein